MIQEAFHGPWRMKVVEAFGFPPMSVVISGSNAADGRHLVDQTAPFEISVDGGRWTVRIEEDDHGTWVPAQARPPSPDGGALRRTRFDARAGLIVTLETGSWAWHPDLGVPFSDILYPGMRLQCTSKDPATHPVPFAPHPEFTLPRGPEH